MRKLQFFLILVFTAFLFSPENTAAKSNCAQELRSTQLHRRQKTPAEERAYRGGIYFTATLLIMASNTLKDLINPPPPPPRSDVQLYFPLHEGEKMQVIRMQRVSPWASWPQPSWQRKLPEFSSEQSEQIVVQDQNH